MSYVTGTHTIKVGAAYQFGKYPRYNNANADLYQSYNNGVRAYYFSIPLMAWFANAYAFLAVTLVVTFVLYRREFSSPMMEALRSVRN